MNECRWINNRGKSNYLEEDLTQCQFVHHKFRMGYRRNEHGCLGREAGLPTVWATARPSRAPDFISSSYRTAFSCAVTSVGVIILLSCAASVTEVPSSCWGHKRGYICTVDKAVHFVRLLAHVPGVEQQHSVETISKHSPHSIDCPIGVGVIQHSLQTRYFSKMHYRRTIEFL
jgi:hypothetical protein